MPPRATAIGLVLLVHLLLLLLLISGRRLQPAEREQPIAFVGLWIEPRSPPPPERSAAPQPAVARPPRSVIAAPRAAPRAEDGPAEPRTAPITVPESPPVDWANEATAAARRHADRREGPHTFSAAPTTLRKPCEPPKSSFEWNPEPARAGFTRTPIPLPFVRAGNCVVGLGFFSCDLAPAGANSHLFDDMKAGRTQESSVPDPDTCE